MQPMGNGPALIVLAQVPVPEAKLGQKKKKKKKRNFERERIIAGGHATGLVVCIPPKA